ncbi:MAG TPA: TIGR03790 family protein [Bryobacteraceae bacterium]|nr:TIGR03790 family protein [Bryobacteraceae bacterium]
MTFPQAQRFARSAAALALLTVSCSAAGPENVLLVVNANSGLSRAIGEYYAKRRVIPAANVCTIRTSDQETISREVFDSSIASAVGACLRSKKLTDSVLYIVTTQGVPLRVNGSDGPNGDKASVDSELTLLYQILRGMKNPLAGTVANPFYRQENATFRHPQFPIYMVTRLAAYDLPGVKAVIDRSLAAKNRGRVFLDLRESGSDRSGDEWLRNAAILLPADRTVIEESTKVLYGQKGVIGYASWGSNDSNRKQRKLGFEWLPGAIATEYVSTNGRTFAKPPDSWNLGTWQDHRTWFAGAPQTLTADLIAEGATGASGHVYEPYLHLTPRPDYLFPAYLSGRNLAESYYIAIPALSWQNIVIGDPLCTLR